jgi:putative pyruvate formate lyase activating enzyme
MSKVRTNANRLPMRKRPFAERAAVARAMLRNCTMCGWRCGLNRLASAGGPCGLSAATYRYKQYLSFNEEPELLPTLRLFLGGCNFGCVYCDEAPHAFDAEAGQRVEPTALARELRAIVARGARSISILGGEPSLHVHTLLETVAAAGRLPIALNSNMYMTPGVLMLLAGVVRWYLADLKYGNDRCARQLAGIPDYSAIVRRSIVRAARHATVIVRHVLLPGHLECCFRPIVVWLSHRLPGIRLQLYTGYVPCGPAAMIPALARLNTRADAVAARAMLENSPLQWQTPAIERATKSPSLGVRESGLASITIGRNGHVYCHDLSDKLVPVLAALSPSDPVLALRGGTRKPGALENP